MDYKLNYHEMYSSSAGQENLWLAGYSTIFPLETAPPDCDGDANLVQVKAAAKLAKMLNRTLVMPKLYCGLENLWRPHKGRYDWGSLNYTLPMQCSMTQLFETVK